MDRLPPQYSVEREVAFPPEASEMCPFAVPQLPAKE